MSPCFSNFFKGLPLCSAYNPNSWAEPSNLSMTWACLLLQAQFLPSWPSLTFLSHVDIFVLTRTYHTHSSLTSEPLYLLFFLPGTLFLSDILITSFHISFRSLFKYHLFREPAHCWLSHQEYHSTTLHPILLYNIYDHIKLYCLFCYISFIPEE